MRTTIVPAQITTIEDRIAGNLNLTQIVLLLTPLFFGSAIYILFLPRLHFAVYKFIFIGISILICCFLAIRIKGKVMLQWIEILVRYNTRPRYFVSNKNDIYLREIITQKETIKKERREQATDKREQGQYEKREKIHLFKRIQLEQIIENPLTNLRITFTKKGVMYGTVKKIK